MTASEDRKYGDVIDELEIGPLRVRVTYSCIRRDMYDMRLGAPLPPTVRAALEPLGKVTGGDALFVLDVEGVHRVTVAPGAGRLVVMPKMATERPAQRAAARELALLVAETLEADAAGAAQP